MSLITLVYVSFATDPMTDKQLLDLLVEARDKNKSLGITGMLLYRHGLFIQALEGEDKVVRKLYKKIKADPRHYNVLEVYRDDIEQRAFADWSMGFNKFDASCLKAMEGYSDFLSSPNTNFFASNPSYAKTLLEMFRDKSSF